jgi:hypothetical protein
MTGMSVTEKSNSERYYSRAELAERYRVSDRTIDRWRDARLYPQPDLILPNGAPRWSDGVVIAHERNSVGKNAAQPSTGEGA